MQYKMVCSDLDGTLLNEKSEITERNLWAVEELTRKGVYFVPSTGRTFSELPMEIRNHPSIRYIIHSNGAVVLDKETQQRYLTCMSNRTVREILDLLYGYETHISVRHNGNCYVDAAMVDGPCFDHYNVCEAHRVVVLDFAEYIQDFKDFVYSADDVEVISVFFCDYEQMQICKKKLAELGGLRIVGVSEYNLEIMDAKAGKGNALNILANMLGLEIAETISVGDSENDRSIIETAGLGLAVSNACEVLKEVADDIICSNEEHMLAYILERYFE